jgi:hypothetical protein
MKEQTTKEELVDVLVKARALVAKGWTKNSYAKTAKGDPVDWDDPKACRFCATGAVYRAVGAYDTRIGMRTFALLDGHPRMKDFDNDIVAFNDSQKTKKPVLQIFDDLIDVLSGVAKCPVIK